MPIYEYRCEACGHEFEVMQKISDKPVRKCESCGRQKAKRIISQTSFVLKGGGWYATDYSRQAKPKGGSKTGSSDGGSEPGSGKGSDGKSAQAAA